MSDKITILSDRVSHLLLTEVQGISLEVREWAKIIQNEIEAEWRKYTISNNERIEAQQLANKKQYGNQMTYDNRWYDNLSVGPKKDKLSEDEIDYILDAIIDHYNIDYFEALDLPPAKIVDLYNKMDYRGLMMMGKKKPKEKVEPKPNIPKPTYVVIQGKDYPKAYAKFCVDRWVISESTTTEYDHRKSGYQEDGAYVVFINCDLSRVSSYVLIHEIKHAYQDWQRIRKNYKPIRNTKEIQDVYTQDFERYIITHRTDIELTTLDSVILAYYMSSNPEIAAYLEGTYDEIHKNLKQPVAKLEDIGKNMAKFKALQVEPKAKPEILQDKWKYVIDNYDIPLFRKFKNVFDFLKYCEKFFNKRGKYIVKKVDRLKTIDPTIIKESVETKSLMNDDKVVVKSAGRKGNGLFAKVDIKAGEMILEAKVNIMDDDDWNVIKDTKPVELYGFVWLGQHGIPLGKWTFDFKKPGEEKLWLQTKFCKQHCKGQLRLSGFLYINDIDEHTQENSKEVFNVEQKLIGMKAIKDIKAGEEIIKEYNEEMVGPWRKKILEDVNEGLNLQKLQLDTPEKWFKNLLSKLTPATSPQYPNSIFYKLGDEINMVYDKENRHLYYSYENIYQVLESEYHLNNQQITTLVKGIVEEHYELGPLTPFEDRTI